jgi:hypothetical protein
VLIPELTSSDMVHRSDDGKLVGTTGKSGQIFAKDLAWNTRLRHSIITTNGVGGVRFRVESLMLRWAAGLKNKNDGFRLTLWGKAVCPDMRFQPQKIAQPHSDQAHSADLQQAPARDQWMILCAATVG